MTVRKAAAPRSGRRLLPVLDPAALGRATLARQMLLAPSDRSPIDAIEHLVGMQAQAPLAPYYGLWCRLRSFRPADLADRMLDRSVVRMALMRSTVHLVSATDAYAFRSVLQPALDRMFASTVSGRTLSAAGVDRMHLAQEAIQVLADRPLTAKELGERLRPRWPYVGASILADGVRTVVSLVQVPPRGIWGTGGVARLAVLDDWVPAAGVGEPTAGTPVERMVWRYLGAFGPASVADIQAWSGLTRLGEVVERMAGDLVTFRTATGTRLFDQPDAPRPHAATPAGVRLIAEFDNLILSHADRTRIIADHHRRRMFTRNGIVPGLVLVDGVGAAMWRLTKPGARGGTTTLLIEAFRPLSAGERDEIESEGRRLLAFATVAAVPEVAAVPKATPDVQFTNA